MGATHGKQKFKNHKGAIYVKCDKSSYHPGETVTGNVYVTLQQRYHFSHIALRLQGKEAYQFHYRVTRQEDGQSIQENKVDKDDKKVYNHQFVIFACQQGFLEAGQYVFPFKFALKDSLPATYHYKAQSEVPSKNNKARIKYSLFCKMHGMNEDKKKKLKTKKEFQIRQHISEKVQSEYKTHKTDLVTWCCINHGEAELKAIFEKNAYVPTEHIKIFFSLNNERGTIGIQRFTATLSKVTHLGKHKVVKLIDKSTMNGVGAGQKLENKNILQLTVPVECKNEPTIESKLINNEYFIEIQGEVDGFTCGGCCGKQPEAKIEIQMANLETKEEMIQQGNELQYFQQFANYQIQLPTQWNPYVYPCANVAFTDAMYIANEASQKALDLNFDYQNYQVNYDYPAQPNAQMNINMQAPDMNVNIQGPNMNTDVNMNINMQGPNMNVQMDGVNMNMQMDGTNMNMQTGGPNMNVQMDANFNNMNF